MPASPCQSRKIGPAPGRPVARPAARPGPPRRPPPWPARAARATLERVVHSAAGSCPRRARAWGGPLLLAALAAAAAPRPAHGGHGGALRLAAVPAGPYAVSVWTRPDPARPGPCQIDIAVMRPGGAPAPEAVVRVRAERPTGDGAEAEARRDADPLGVRHRAVLDLREAGRWEVTVAVQGPEGAGRATFSLDVEPGGRGPWALGALALAGAAALAWRLSRRSALRRTAGAGGLVLLAAAAAWGHAALVRSSPARRATLAAAPERVQLWFNEPVEPRFSTVSVWDAAGRQVDRGDARVEPGEPTRLVVGLPSLGPGSYRVRFRVLSVDGHVVEGEFPFTVRR